MQKEDVVRRLCGLGAAVSKASGYQFASDCLCSPEHLPENWRWDYYEGVLEFIEAAVWEKLGRGDQPEGYDAERHECAKTQGILDLV